MVRIQKISLLFILLLVSTFANAQQFEKSYDDNNDGSYTIIYQYTDAEENKLEVYSCSSSSFTGAIVIPEKEIVTDGGSSLPVVSICKEAFANCAMTSIRIPANVNYIGADAFKDCGNLNKAIFTSIEDLCKITFVTQD